MKTFWDTAFFLSVASAIIVTANMITGVDYAYLWGSMIYFHIVWFHLERTEISGKMFGSIWKELR